MMDRKRVGILVSALATVLVIVMAVTSLLPTSGISYASEVQPVAGDQPVLFQSDDEGGVDTCRIPKQAVDVAAVIDSINVLRAERGCSVPLVENDTLSQEARIHARSMRDTGEISDIRNRGTDRATDSGDRIEEAGYPLQTEPPPGVWASGVARVRFPGATLQEIVTAVTRNEPRLLSECTFEEIGVGIIGDNALCQAFVNVIAAKPVIGPGPGPDNCLCECTWSDDTGNLILDYVTTPRLRDYDVGVRYKGSIALAPGWPARPILPSPRIEGPVGGLGAQ